MTKTMTSSRRAAKRRFTLLYFRNLGLFLFALLALLYIAVAIFIANAGTTAYRHPPQATPASLGLTYENVTFPAAEDDLQLRGWLVKSSTPSARIIIITHGKDANRAEAGFNGLGLIGVLATHGYNVLAYDLRGHGESAGDHFSFGQFEQRDLLGAISYVEKRGYTPAHIGALGYSMGAATTIMVAARTPDIHAIVSDSAYASLPDLLDDAFPLPRLFLPGALLAGRIQFGFEPDTVIPEKAIAHLGSRHIYLIQGLSDSLVAPSNVDRLARAAGSSLVGVWKVPGVEHVHAFITYPDQYTQRVIGFFDAELPVA